MQITVSHKGSTRSFDVAPSSTLSDLQDLLSEEYAIEPSLQKINCRGKLLKDPQASLESLGLTDSSKIQLFGAAASQVAALHHERSEIQRRADVVASRKTAVPRNTQRSGFSSIGGQKDVRPRFLQITPFPEGPLTPHLEQRKAMLEKLAADPAIMMIMQNDNRDLRVGNLTELHPHKDPQLLGLNEIAGQQVSLRLLHENLAGLYTYNAVRRVLIHELTHNIHSGHELPFMELDSKMTKEVAAYKPPQGHRLGGDIGEVYNAQEAREAEQALHARGHLEAERSAGSRTAGHGSATLMGQRLGSGSDGPQMGSSSTEDERLKRLEAIQRRAAHGRG